MILRDHKIMGKKLNGIYIIEAKCQSEVDSIKNTSIFGTRIMPFKLACQTYLDGVGQLYYRKLTCLRDSNFVELLTNQIEKVYGSPYDV